jgi:RNA polymerase sigma-70 factor (ECF subfamily)
MLVLATVSRVTMAGWLAGQAAEEPSGNLWRLGQVGDFFYVRRQIRARLTLLIQHVHPTDLPMEDTPPHDSWKNWFRQHGPRLLLYARQTTRSLADAEDVVQEAFVRFWRHQRGLGGEPLGLVFASIRRAACDLARRNERRLRREESAGREELPAGGEVVSFFEPLDEGDERRVAIEGALRDLPDEQREVLTLKIWGEQTFEQIGAQLGISPHTAASRYRYALEALRKRLTPENCPLP